MERFAVEARIFNSGMVVAKIREAEMGEESGVKETEKCDIWVDVFDDYSEARRFLRGYKEA